MEVKEEDSRVEYDVSVVGSPEVFGGEQPSPGNARPESNEQSIEKKDQSPQSHEVFVLDSGEIPHEVNIHEQLKAWQWVFIDNIQLPALARGNDLYLAVHNVQLRLLSRFPPGLSKDILNKYTMVSHRMTAIESWTLNSINAVIRKCELGCQLFTPEDEVVLLRDVERFYWNIKAINLNHMVQRYEEEIRKAHNNITLMAVATSIKQHVEVEVEECKTNIQRVEAEFASGIPFANIETSPIGTMSGEVHAMEGKFDINVYS